MRTGLVEAWWSRVCDGAEESEERLCAAHNLAYCRRRDVQYAVAARVEREVLDARRRMLGEEHPDTVMSASNLALSLSYQGKYVQAERIEREVVGKKRRVLGEENPDTLTSANNLEISLSTKGSTRRRSGSTGRCLMRGGGCWARVIPTR